MKNYLTVCGLLCGVGLLLAVTTVNAATLQVANPGSNADIRQNLESAVAAAAPTGDTLVLPAGTFKLSGTVTIAKFLTLRGQSLSATVLYRDESTPDDALKDQSMILFAPNSTSSGQIRLRGMTLRSKRPSIVQGDGYSVAADYGVAIKNAVDFKVEGCRFENFGNGAILVRHEDGLARGLITRNEFFHNAKGFDGLGLGYGVVIYGADLQWIPDPRFGSDNFIFIEDNTFDYHRHAIAAGGGALYVARYNIITNNTISQFASTQAIDAHEARGGTPGNGNYYSTRAVEAYRNTIVNTTFHNEGGVHDGTVPIVSGMSVTWLVERAIQIRGGEALIHDNAIDGYRFALGVSASLFPGDSAATYPIRYAVGYASGAALGTTHAGSSLPEGDGDVFYWNNSFAPYDGTPSGASTEFHNYNPESAGVAGLVSGRDYHALAKPAYLAYPYPHPLQCESDDVSRCTETPLVHYRFDDPNQRGLDSSLGRNGQVVAAVTGGIVGQGILTGGNDGVQEFRASVPELNLAGAASGIAWIKPAGPHGLGGPPNCPNGTVFTKGGNIWFLVDPDNSRIALESNYSGVSQVGAVVDIPVGRWSQIAFTRTDGQAVTFYKDGQALGSPQVLSIAPQANTKPFTIGYADEATPDECQFNGVIDEVKVFDRALSAAQIKAEFDLVNPLAVPATRDLGRALLIGTLAAMGILALTRRRAGSRG